MSQHRSSLLPDPCQPAATFRHPCLLPRVSEASDRVVILPPLHQIPSTIPVPISTRCSRSIKGNLFTIRRTLSSNLISIPTLPPTPKKHATNISFRYINARNLKNKSVYFLDHVSEHSPDIVAITQTWFTPQDDAARSECTPSGYKLFDQVRLTSRQGGGLALLIRDSFTTNRNSSKKQSSFESADWIVSRNNTRLRVIIIYRPPYSSNHSISISTFLDEFSSYLESVVICSEPLIIAGDFNIHMDNPSDSKHFSELLESISLTQHVHQPTHVVGHTLDLIITRSSDHILCSDPTTDQLFSDHFSISCLLSLLKPHLESKEVTIRPKMIDLQPFLDDLASSELCRNPPHDPDDLLISYNTTLRWYTNSKPHHEIKSSLPDLQSHGLMKKPKNPS